MSDLPRSAEEWQEVLDFAQGLLELDACRQYGLIEGGPKPDIERCRELLEEGKKRGYKPGAECGVRLAKMYMGGG